MEKDKKQEEMQKARHSLAHILAKALTSLYPNTKLTIGPSIDDGFYYDIDLDINLTPDHFPEIEKKMKEIINNGEDFTRKVVSKEEALKLFKGNEYKTEIINELPENEDDYNIDYDFLRKYGTLYKHTFKQSGDTYYWVSSIPE